MTTEHFRLQVGLDTRQGEGFPMRHGGALRYNSPPILHCSPSHWMTREFVVQ